MRKNLATQYCCFCGLLHGQTKKKMQQPFVLWKCSNCKTVQLYPKPTDQELSEIYSQDYFCSQKVGYSNYASQEAALKKTYSHLLEIHKINVKGKIILDVGSGPGFFLSLAKEKGASDLYAIEPSLEAQKALRAMGVTLLGDKIENTEIEKHFDIIACIQTLEHLMEPKILLSKLYSALEETGLLIIAVPNYNSWLRIFLGRKWPSYKIPEHLTYFNKKTLTYALNQSGVRNFTITNMAHYFPLAIIQDNGIKIIPKKLASKLFKLKSTSLVAIVKKES